MTEPSTPPRTLLRRPADGKIAGICAGLADYFGVDVTLVRLAWLVLSIVPGAVLGGVLAYLAAWVVMPAASEPARRPTEKRLVKSATNRKVAGVCGGLAEYLGVDATLVRLFWIVLAIIPGAIVGGVIAYLLGWFVMPSPQQVPVTAGPGSATPAPL